MENEANNNVSENDVSVDESMDKLFDDYEKENSDQVTSPEEKTTESEAETSKDVSDPDTAKKESEEEETKDDEGEEIPKEFHKHPAWQKLIARAKEAEQKAEELAKSNALDDDTKKALDEFKQYTSSKDYLEEKLKREGYKDEAIQRKLEEAGFSTHSDNQLDIAAKALNLDLNSLSDQDKADIGNLAKIADALMMNRLQKILPETINPLKETVDKITQKEQGHKLYDEFAKQVKEDGILDFEKDIAPELVKYLDTNEPKGITQKDVGKFLQDTYLKKVVLYKKASTREKERKDGLRGNKPGGEGFKTGVGLPEKTGNIEKDMDAVLDHLGVQS